MKKIAVIAIIGMLALGASFLTVQAQNQPTGAPDTSVTSRPPKLAPATTTAVPAVANQPRQEAFKEPAVTNNTMIVGIIVAVLIAGLVTVVLIRRNKSKKKV